MLKVDLGCNVDGYVAVVATTVVVAAEGFAKNITGRQADVLMATHVAADVASRLIKAGAKGSEVSAAINKVAESFRCTPVLGVCSHNVTRNTLDGEKTIIPKYDEGQKPDECEIVQNEVYVVDVVMSTGDGKPKEVQERTTVYMRAPSTTYALKMKASRYALSQIQEKHPHFPFSLRTFVAGEEAAKFKMGIKECVEHGILTAYPVLEEKRDQFVGHVKFTVLVMPNGPLKVTGASVDVEQIKTDLKVTDEDLLKLLATSVKKKKKPKKKKAPAAGAAAGAGAAGAKAEAEAEESGED
jgi:curved DNA binding protein